MVAEAKKENVGKEKGKKLPKWKGKDNLHSVKKGKITKERKQKDIKQRVLRSKN